MLPFLALVGLYQRRPRRLRRPLLGAGRRRWRSPPPRSGPSAPRRSTRPGSPRPRTARRRAPRAVIAAYLPNEADTIVETVEAFLAQDYAGGLQVVLAYNTPARCRSRTSCARSPERPRLDRASRSPTAPPRRRTSTPPCASPTGEFVGIFDADHHPMPGAFERAWRWLADGADVVQGHCVIRNGDESWLARLVAVEFEQIYAVSHPGRAALHGFGIFGGSNGYWRASALEQIRLRGSFLTEDIEASMRVARSRRPDRHRPGPGQPRARARTPSRRCGRQRMRWAQGWFQVSCRHLGPILRSPRLTLRQKLGVDLPARLARGLPVARRARLAAARLPGLARRRARLRLADLPAGHPVRHGVRPAADAGRLAAGRPRAAASTRAGSSAPPWPTSSATPSSRTSSAASPTSSSCAASTSWVVTPRTAPSTAPRTDARRRGGGRMTATAITPVPTPYRSGPLPSAAG